MNARSPIAEARRNAGLALVIIFATLFAAACGGYARRMDNVRMSIERNDMHAAFDDINDLVGRAEAGERPERFDLPLLLLERGAIRQAMGDHEGAVRDLNDADQMMEVLDLTPDGIGNAAEYLWSGDLKIYRPPIYEKLMINVMALSSYLHMGRLSSARVEARRARVLIEYFQSTELADHPMVAAANYMAGLAMELNGESTSALRFYMDAWVAGPLPGLAEGIVRLSEGTRQAQSAEVREARAHLGLGEGDTLEEAGPEVIVIVFGGLAPRREAEYLPVGMVYAWMATSGGPPVNSEQQAQYNRIVADGLLTWVNFPVLNRFTNRLQQYHVSVGGQAQKQIDEVANIEGFVIDEWERVRGQIAVAAITRAIVRVVAREATRAAGRAAGLDDAVPGLSWVAGLAVQGAMQAADRPDTRNWTTLPATLRISRLELPPGEHTINVRAAGAGGVVRRAEAPVRVPERGIRVVAVRFMN